MQPARTKIIVTDDHRIFRTAVRQGLSRFPDIEIIAEAEDGWQLLHLLKHLQPDIVIMGIQMPVMDGLTTMPILRQKFPLVKVIILSMHSDPSVICRMLEKGANSYLTKEAGPEEIYETIHALKTRWFYINKTVMNAIAKKKGVTKTELPSFSDKEIIILHLLKANKSVEQIAVAVGLNQRTIMAIIDKLKFKSSVTSINELLSFAIKHKIIA